MKQAINQAIVRGPIYWFRVVSFTQGATMSINGAAAVTIAVLMANQAESCRGWDKIETSGIVTYDYADNPNEPYPGPIGNQGSNVAPDNTAIVRPDITPNFPAIDFVGSRNCFHVIVTPLDLTVGLQSAGFIDALHDKVSNNIWGIPSGTFFIAKARPYKVLRVHGVRLINPGAFTTAGIYKLRLFSLTSADQVDGGLPGSTSGIGPPTQVGRKLQDTNGPLVFTHDLSNAVGGITAHPAQEYPGLVFWGPAAIGPLINSEVRMYGEDGATAAIEIQFDQTEHGLGWKLDVGGAGSVISPASPVVTMPSFEYWYSVDF